MAEVKNAFIKSKMNKDLDDRLLPSGEYRNAINAQVSKSEGSDVGALENVLGNSLIVDFTSIAATATVSAVYASIGIGVVSINGSLLAGYKVITNDYVNNITVVDTSNATPPDPTTFVTFSSAVNFSVGQVISFAPNLTCIGYLTNESTSDIYLFLTDNDDNTLSTYHVSGPRSNNFIYVHNTQTSTTRLLVEGAFLNFHKQSPIYGVNLLEQLLFWTDNRNQPRKIDVTKANPSNESNPTYYTNEDQVSVAKYNPYKAMYLYQESSLSPGDYESTMKNVTNKFQPNGGSCNNTSVNVTNSSFLTISQLNIPFYPKQPVLGMSVKRVDDNGAIVPFQLNNVDVVRTVASYDSVNNLLELNGPVDAAANVEIIFNENPYHINNYPGDPRLNEDNFLRFSYRFRFNEGEYSIIAPFTQICFIPQQDGYFLAQEPGAGDEQQAYESSIVDFMRNKVNEVRLQVPLPSIGSLLSSNFHVTEIDILYKESDSIAVKVVETIPVSELSSLSSNVYEYVYQSKKPYKTLPNSDLIRVYDKIPVKAFSQEIISNRIVYGNYQNKHTPPSSLNYNVSAGLKSNFSLGLGSATAASAVDNESTVPLQNSTGEIKLGSLVDFGSGEFYSYVVDLTGFPVTSIVLDSDVNVSAGQTISFKNPSVDADTTSGIEYPSSSLKTNRNYQVGVVLSDKFGRQSTVILSNSKIPKTVGNQTYVGSTLYSPYVDNGVESEEWFGNSLKMLFNETIGPSSPNPNTGEPGIYNGNKNSIDYNPLGWYSYKVVVKQTEQEYYNVYSAGAMKGLPYDYNTKSVSGLSNNNSFIVLVNDNINKIPRDLSLVGPQDKTFRSSVRLYGRVQNTASGNEQFYPNRESFTTTNIENLFNMFDVSEFYGPYISTVPVTSTLNAFHGFYRSDSNPFIADINTSQNASIQFGTPNSFLETVVTGNAQSASSGSVVTVNNVAAGAVILIGSILTSPNIAPTNSPHVVTNVSGSQSPFTVTLDRDVTISNNSDLTFTFKAYKDINTLAVFETAPVESRLDIFWETSTSGLVNDLNNLILRSGEEPGASDLSAWNTNNYREDIGADVDILTSNFTIKDSFGANIEPNTIESISLTVQDTSASQSDVSGYFTLYHPQNAANGFYNVKTTALHVQNIYFGSESGLRNFVFKFVVNITGSGTVTIIKQVSLANIAPTIGQGEEVISFNSLNSSGNVSTHSGINGALISGPNEQKDLVWTLISQTNSSGDDLTQGQQPYFNILTNQSGSVATLNRIPTVVPADVYTNVIQLQDAGGTGLIDTLTVNVNYLATINLSQSLVVDVQVDGSVSDLFECVIFQVINFDLLGQNTGNGFYVYEGTFSDLTNYATSGQIVLNKTNANTGSTCYWTWYYSGVSKQAAVNLWASCVGIPQGGSYFYSNFNSSNFDFSIK